MLEKKWFGCRQPAGISLMIIPLIDVIFLLLLFFVMTTSFEVTTRIRIQLPRPEQSQARYEDPLKNIVIHCEYSPVGAPDGSRALYRFGADPPEQLATISTRLAAAVAHQSNPKVIIRADRRLAFREIRQVMEVVADNKVTLLQVSMLRGPER